MQKDRTYVCIDLKSFYASVECRERGLDPMTTNLVVADPERSDKTICLAVSPAMKKLGVPGRCRVFEIPKGIEYIMAPPRMQLYIDYSAEIYAIYLKYISKEDIHVYSIDEVFMDVTDYLAMYQMSAKELSVRIMEDILEHTGITATAGIGTNLYLAKVALDITAKHVEDHIGILDEESYCKTLWNHKPLTDFWRMGKGIANRLEQSGIRTIGEIEAIGAGDQGMMFGYACDETPELMPYPISLAHKLTRKLTEVRKNGTLGYLRPDGKSQVTVEYDEAGVPKRLDAVVLSTQHDPDVTQEQIHEDIKKYVFDAVIPAEMVDDKTKFFINPTGRFVIGGPHGDSGVTGRKIIVDTYGGMARHGGGAFSGKDCTKVDRSAAYAARYVAKNIVAAGIAKKCEIQLSYAIGVAQPTSIMIDTFGTGKISEEKLVDIVRENFDLRPAGIIKMLDLRRPIYKQTAAYGHFGRTDLDLSWEKTDKAEILKSYL